MSREIKFRAWDENYWERQYQHPDGPPPNAKPRGCGDWLDGDDILDTLGTNHCDCFVIQINTVFTAKNLQSGFILEQFTGLLDKHGKEIYEGDIIRDVDTKETGTVGFELGGFYCTIDWGTDFYKGVYRNGEIIGNIHENPELLRQEEK